MFNEMEYEFLLNDCKGSEYYCRSCKQLRLDLRIKGEDVCGNCGSCDIVRGDIGSFDKAELMKGE